MNRMQDQVADFHRKFGHPVGTTPSFSRPELRAKLILEEAIETAVGLLGSASTIDLLRTELFDLGVKAPKQPDIVEAADGMCDLLYVTFGSGVEMGVDLQGVFDEVHTGVTEMTVQRLFEAATVLGVLPSVVLQEVERFLATQETRT